MKQRIAGIAYNTDTATLLAEWSNDKGRRDHGYVSESIYRTRTGRLFVEGAGGPASRWSERVGNASIAGSGLRALSDVEACAWWADHGRDAVVACNPLATMWACHARLVALCARLDRFRRRHSVRVLAIMASEDAGLDVSLGTLQYLRGDRWSETRATLETLDGVSVALDWLEGNVDGGRASGDGWLRDSAGVRERVLCGFVEDGFEDLSQSWHEVGPALAGFDFVRVVFHC